jgi:hypothetical protein
MDSNGAETPAIACDDLAVGAAANLVPLETVSYSWLPPVNHAWSIARMLALIGSGSVGQRLTSIARSASMARFSAPSAARSAAPLSKPRFSSAISGLVFRLQIRHRGFDSHRRFLSIAWPKSSAPPLERVQTHANRAGIGADSGQNPGWR